MLDEFAVEKLKQIKAGFDALQAENEELRAELALLRADKVDIAAVMAQNAEVDSLRAELAEARAIILDLVKTIDASTYGEDSLHHHTCPAPNHGACACGAHDAMDAARQEEYKGAK